MLVILTLPWVAGVIGDQVGVAVHILDEKVLGV
jgi:hypothetical protein